MNKSQVELLFRRTAEQFYPLEVTAGVVESCYKAVQPAAFMRLRRPGLCYKHSL